MIARLPEDEAARLDTLHRHHILDTDPEEKFDDLVRLAAHVCGTPIAAVSLVDAGRQWFKASVGLDVTETPRDVAFCAHTILRPDLDLVPDARTDPRFADNPQVTAGPRFRFYAGVPLVAEDGHALGSLCVIDRTPRRLAPAQESALRALARQASLLLRATARVAARERLLAEKERAVLEKERAVAERERAEDALARTHAALAGSEAALRTVLESAPVVLYAADAAGTVTLSAGKGLAALGLKAGEAIGRSVFEFTGGDAGLEAATRRALAGGAVSYDARVYGLCLHTELRPVRGADGAPAGVVGVCTDVTERVLSEERFRVLFEQSSHAHLLFDEAGGILDCNAATVSMMRCRDKVELLGRHPATLSPEFQPDGRRSDEKGAQMCALARRHGGHRFEWQRRAADGHEYPVEVTLTPVTLAGRPVLFAVWYDLTERARQEERLRDHAVILEFQEAQRGELERANAALEALATTDGLTGLKNHRAFQERLAEEVSRAGRYGPPLSVVLLDVDHFKRYNDSHGHPAGDAVLRKVAGALQEVARATDLVARYGGEEFALILPQTDLGGAAALAERLRASVAGRPGLAETVTVSLGVAALRPGEPGGAELLARADEALYRSKGAGRNRVTCASDRVARHRVRA